jgi:hypothetical protein
MKEKLLLRLTAHESSNTAATRRSSERSHVASKNVIYVSVPWPWPYHRGHVQKKFKFLLRHCILYSSTVVSNFDTYIFLTFWQIQERKRLNKWSFPGVNCPL